MRHAHYADPPTVGHINWVGLFKTLLFIAAFVVLVWWVVGLIAGDAALVDWLPRG